MRKFSLTATVSALALCISSDVLLHTSLLTQPVHAQSSQQSSNLSDGTVAVTGCSDCSLPRLFAFPNG